MQLLILFSGMTAVLICITSSVSYLQLRSVANEVSISTMNNYLIQTLNSLDIFLAADQLQKLLHVILVFRHASLSFSIYFYELV